MKKITASLLLAALIMMTPACYVGYSEPYVGYQGTGAYIGSSVTGMSTWEGAAIGGAVGAIGGYRTHVYPRYYGGAGYYRGYRRAYRYY